MSGPHKPYTEIKARDLNKTFSKIAKTEIIQIFFDVAIVFLNYCTQSILWVQSSKPLVGF